MDARGRIVIPLAIRRQMGASGPVRMVVTLEGGKLRIEVAEEQPVIDG